MDNDSGLEILIQTFLQRFIILISIAFELLINETFFLQDACYCRPPA